MHPMRCAANLTLVYSSDQCLPRSLPCLMRTLQVRRLMRALLLEVPFLGLAATKRGGVAEHGLLTGRPPPFRAHETDRNRPVKLFNVAGEHGILRTDARLKGTVTEHVLLSLADRICAVYNRLSPSLVSLSVKLLSLDYRGPPGTRCYKSTSGMTVKAASLST